ncbi:hypothetical protein ACE10Z_34515 [Bradyrhizobium sp. Pha-3]|uniref:hypothetical protein n=1 Tax=Bradyrhizobium sp. Pha-3 TaxID=208375 RepID=UPI0035D48010
MTRPYSEDIRERALARADADETVRSIAEELQISPSGVTKWKNLGRDPRGLSPGKIGGRKKRVLPDAHAHRPRKRIRSGLFTLRKLTQQPAARGIEISVRAVWMFSHRRAELNKAIHPTEQERPDVVRTHPVSRLERGAKTNILSDRTPQFSRLPTPARRVRSIPGEIIEFGSRRLRLRCIGTRLQKSA